MLIPLSPETLVKEINQIVNKKIKGYSSRAKLVKDGVKDGQRESKTEKYLMLNIK